MYNTSRNGRYNGHCSKCGKVVSFLNVGLCSSGEKLFANQADGNIAEYVNGNLYVKHTCPVNPATRYLRLRIVLGKYNPERECNSLCMAARGHNCECSCGGQNHGAAHAA